MRVVAGANKSFSYDANGNTISITDHATSETTTFEWDAADQLRRIEYHDGTATEFRYDAMGRRVRLIEWDDSDPQEETSSKYFLWGGLAIAEERDGDSESTVTRRYYAQGEIRGSTKYFYGRDHLGSVREVVDTSLTVVARYDYDPYGRREQTSGTFDVDWGFTGHYFHEKSGLHLAPFRAYSAELGRWLSRDPIGESGGLNLYEYVRSNPVNDVDPLGLVSSLKKYPAATEFALGTGRVAATVASSKGGGAALSGLIDAGLSYRECRDLKKALCDGLLGAALDLATAPFINKLLGVLPLGMLPIGIFKRADDVPVTPGVANAATPSPSQVQVNRTNGLAFEPAAGIPDGPKRAINVDGQRRIPDFVDPGQRILRESKNVN